MSVSHYSLLKRVFAGEELTADEALSLADVNDLPALMETAGALRDRAHGSLITYSRKVFIPLTKLCRDFCHYCTFAQKPRSGAAYLTPDEVLEIARGGARAGCQEALFTLGDKPELRYQAARDGLERLGYSTTLSYLAAMARWVHKETGLLPHLNPGVMTAADIRQLRTVSVSQGIMLETVADRLGHKGGPHYGSPDKSPAARIETIREAGEAAVPFTSGILIGIGETRRERIEALLCLRDLHSRYGHLQEIIVQNFRPKPNTAMADVPATSVEDHLWTIAVARIVLGPNMNIQAPPNLAGGPLANVIAAGINDWGGVSPVTPDHVNPEAPWPAVESLTSETAKAEKVLVERLAIYPSYVHTHRKWVDPLMHSSVLRMSDSEGLARPDSWVAGVSRTPPSKRELRGRTTSTDNLKHIVQRASDGEDLSVTEIATLFGARDADFITICDAADRLRQRVCGDRVTYVVNRNINYTNICYFHCKFCAFSKGKLTDHLRGRPYDLPLQEIQRRAQEAWSRGATEVCLQGGIHPDYTGATYLSICRAIKEVAPDIHIHAFSPLEVSQGAATLGVSIREFLQELKQVGLGTLPGTAAEILDDDIRAIICPDKLSTQGWLDVVETAHAIGLRTTSTIMYGHVDGARNWATHLLHLRNLQKRSGGITEFVPLPFVPMETPMYIHGRCRRGPTFREAVLMHAVARLALYPLITNIQASWVKMGPEGLRVCLQAGVNDIGGTLMNESITRAAGASHGEEMPPSDMEALITSLGRTPRQRTTLYEDPPDDQYLASFSALPLQTPSIEARSVAAREESADA